MHQQLARRGREHADAGGRAEQHERELAALRERHGEPLPFVAGNLRERRDARTSRANLITLKPTASADQQDGVSRSSLRFALMPTVMKKRPSSRPLKGSMSASSSCLTSSST